MWSIFGARPFDSPSTRRITVFLLAILVALFAATAIYTAPAQAQTATDVDQMATWVGDNLEYNGWTLQKAGDGRNIPSLDGTVCDNNQNVYSSDINRSASEPGKSIIVVACFNEGADVTDKSKSLPAQILLYRADEGTTSASQFKPSAPTAIAVAPLGSDSLGNDSSEPATSCDSTYTKGLGWIICPITNFLAAGMDWLFNVLTNFLVVQPTSTDQASPLYRAWSFMRNLANVLFVVGFLVIIYSQVTTLGLSSYGVKRMLPRLVVAAIFVNVSFWLTAVAIDLSNILGFAFQQMFVSIRNSLVVPGVTTETWQIISWERLAGVILSGGAIAAGVGLIGASLVTAGVGASIMLLLPILVGVLVSALIAVLVLAARQALITILVIISPLACVAYLLPNTEKYFERWRDLFGTMLLVFPIFSIVFGGAQLAGTAIILNAPKDGPNGINVILLGMAVQVIPLAITPLLIKVSGNLLGRVAGIVNNPNKGLIDKTRNFSNERAALASARRRGAISPDGSFRHNWPATRIARRLQNSKIDRAGRLKAYESSTEAGYANTEKAHRTHAISNTANLRKTSGDSHADQLFNEAVQNNEGLRRLDVQSRVNQQGASYTKSVNDNAFERMKANPTVDTALGDLAIRAQAFTNDEKTQANRLSTAKRVQDSNYNEDLARNEAMQTIAGDSSIDPHGATRVKTAAQAQQSAAYQERIKNFRNSFNYENIKEADALELALGRDAAGYTSSEELQEAAIEHVIGLGHVETMIRLQEGIDLTESASATVRQTYAAALKNSTQKPKFVPTSALTDAIPQGLPDTPAYRGQELVNTWVERAVIGHKYDTNALATTDRDDIEYVRQTLVDERTGAHKDVFNRLNATTEGAGAVRLLQDDIKRAFKDEQIYRTLGNRLEPLQKLGVAIGVDIAELQPPTP